MTLTDQRHLLARWQVFLAGRTPSNDILREFYLAEVTGMEFYRYGIACEVFDVLINGIFDVEAAASWNGRGAADGVRGAAAKTVAAA